MLKTAGLTDTGRYRSNNEDSYSIEGPVLVVADGMGGAAAGEVASSIAVDAITRKASKIKHSSDSRIGKAVSDAFMSADSEIRKRISKTPELRGMGTTAVLALPFGHHVMVANVGDSRVYHFPASRPVRATAPDANSKQNSESEEPQRRFSAIYRVTTDHSVVMELVKAEIINEEDIRTHPLRNRITRCLGSCEAGPDIQWLDVNDGDGLLLCSDGLWEMVHEDLILAIFNSSETPEEICRKLIDAANNGGGVDNITAIAAIF